MFRSDHMYGRDEEDDGPKLWTFAIRYAVEVAE